MSWNPLISFIWRKSLEFDKKEKGGNDRNSPNSNGIIDESDILHVILLWTKSDTESKELSWTLLGKWDLAHDKNHGYTSVEDANY